ncbi:non-ribosomal peptide synthetase [Micromonospora echinofusca]|uniref:Amino acid adenylation domain-containing protein n=1 Tax=Micromonospora echinofusca TaxID=47858 RepID=A0ABS3VK09_MICEH|nr:non-ribosomal peptide synthetase [Micromonospora echinofusca]MBO4204847.1 amino acid adenylation domain-containing protein [Micromonospora echinofusca]
MTDQADQLLAVLLARRGIGLAVSQTIRPGGRDGDLPLSPAQQRIWFLDRLGVGDSSYLLSGAHRLRGELRVDALAGAVRRLVHRHEPLRTAFVEADGVPAQRVLGVDDPRLELPLPVVDLSGTPAADQERRLARLVRHEASRPFDLGVPPLVRATLVRLATDDHVLLLSYHHIVCDDISTGLLFAELTAGYDALLAGPAPLPAPPPVQFADYVRWLGERDRGLLGEQEEYWQAHLAGAPALLDLPTDRPRPGTPGAPGDTCAFTLSAELTAAVARLRAETDCTLFTVLLAAFTIVLAEQSGQDDVVVGVPVTNRSLPELEDMVGMFVNTLALRTDLGGDPTLREALGRVRRTCLGGLGHRDVPLERVTELVAPERDPGHHPLFQVMFVLNPAGDGQPSMSGLTVQAEGAPTGTARFDLTLVMVDGGDRLTGRLDHHAGLFDPSTVRRLVDRLVRALTALTTTPYRRLSELELGDPDERRLLAAGLRPAPLPGSGMPSPSDSSGFPGYAHDLVAAQTARTPDAPAVTDADGTVSYRELGRRADRLAWRLYALGVRPETPVALALPAGPDGIAGILGILRAGGAYLPLDPGHPPQRLAALLADSGTRVLVTAVAHRDLFAGLGLSVVCVDELTGPPAPDRPPPAVARRPDQLAYVVYTSGSTGRPKGVMVSHATLSRLTVAFRDAHGFGPGQRILMIPPLTFDASVGDVFPALASGAALTVHPEPAALTGPALVELCGEQRITAVDAPSALWQRWVDDLDGHRLPDDLPLSVMMVGGERVPADKLAAWQRLTGGRVAFYNHYGPTEATVCATVHRVDPVDRTPGAGRVPPDVADGPGDLPIGRPLPHVRAYVLGTRQRPRPLGTVGELYLGGDCLARGYLGRPDLTARMFVPDPFSDVPGARMYRTGDLARVRLDGTLEFLGRVDRQVKIRGHRIEPAEIETVLGQHPQLAGTVVVARGQRLVAFVVPRSATAVPDRDELHAFLRDRLPEYLVPAVFVTLDRLPLTAHGKVDQRRLPADDGGADQPFQAPGTPTEARLAQVWAEVLGRDRVGARDGFFDLGGHSLLAAPLLARVNREFGVRLPLRALFESPRLDAFATLVDRHRDGGAGRGGHTGTGGPGGSRGVRRADLRAEATLPDDVCADLTGRPAPVAADRASDVLLTGATGFLGAFLLDELLRRTGADVHCLVRASSVGAAMNRIEQNLRWYGRWRPEYAARIAPVPGELAAPRLGLPARDFDALAEQVDVIYHNGGAVHFAQPYEQLRPANVNGTVEVLRLAGRARPSALHHVSTLGVYLGAYRSGTIRESDPPEWPDGLWGGYNESKWVADTLVRAARGRGLPVSVHRPARVTGDSRTGAGSPDDYFSRLLTTFVQVNAVPMLDHPEDAAPVDYVAAAIVALSRRAEHLGRDHHYHNPRTIGYDGIAAVLRGHGYPVRSMPYEHWHAEVTRVAAEDPGRLALGPFTSTLPPTAGPREHPVFDCARTEAAVAPDGITCPAADAGLLGRYVGFLTRSGALPAPGIR